MKPIFAGLSLALFFICFSSIGFNGLAYGDQQQYFQDSDLDLHLLMTKVQNNKNLKILDFKSEMDFAAIIKDSGLPYESIEPRLKHFLKEKNLPFVALDKAIEREHSSRWRKAQIRELKESPDHTANLITKAKLDADDQEKVLKVYALCIKPFANEQSRQSHFTAKICEPVDGYIYPVHQKNSVSLRTKPSPHRTAQISAYQLLINAGQDVAKEQDLNDADRLMMAKCMAENALRFWPPAQHPFTAVQESYKLSHRSPEKAFFRDHGICSNFSGLSYNLAKALGFKGPLFLARHKLHVYLEAQLDGLWYHSHPFNSTAKSCDFIRFRQ